MGNKNVKSENIAPSPQLATNKTTREPGNLGRAFKEFMPHNKAEWKAVAKPMAIWGGAGLTLGLAFALFNGISQIKGQREYVRQAETLGYRTITNNESLTQVVYLLKQQYETIISAAKEYNKSTVKGYENRRSAAAKANKEKEDLEKLQNVILSHCDFVVGLYEIGKAFKNRHSKDGMMKLSSLIEVHQPPDISSEDVRTANHLTDLVEDSIIQVQRSIQFTLNYVEKIIPVGLHKDESPIYTQFVKTSYNVYRELIDIKTNLMRDVRDATRGPSSKR